MTPLHIRILARDNSLARLLQPNSLTASFELWSFWHSKFVSNFRFRASSLRFLPTEKALRPVPSGTCPSTDGPPALRRSAPWLCVRHPPETRDRFSPP